MSKLSTIKRAAKLRRFTKLLPLKRNVTRWSSTDMMVKRYFQIREYLDTRDSELKLWVPDLYEEKALKELETKLKDIESVTLKLQEEDIDMLSVRKLFDALIKRFPVMAQYLSPTADIVHYQAFESGVCKILVVEESLDNSK